MGNLPLKKLKFWGLVFFYFKFMGNYLDKIIFSTRLKTVLAIEILLLFLV